MTKPLSLNKKKSCFFNTSFQNSHSLMKQRRYYYSEIFNEFYDTLLPRIAQIQLLSFSSRRPSTIEIRFIANATLVSR